jgi:hypothetical protein
MASNEQLALEPTASELLAAWRAAERAHSLAAAGSPEAAALNDDMRRLMDEYQWVVRGRVGPRPPRDAAERDWMGRVLASR